MSLLLAGAHLVDPRVSLDEVGDILIDNEGMIAEIGASLDTSLADEVRDCGGKVIVPGLVDIHVHFREPGFEYKEDIATGSLAAAHGGYTAVVTMPNTKPCCDTGAQIALGREKALRVARTRIYQAGSLTKGLKGQELSDMEDMAREGACAFTDDGRGVQDDEIMGRCMKRAQELGLPVMSHCQVESLVGDGVINEGEVSQCLGLTGWPSQGENLQIERDIKLCELTGCPLHIQHISTKDGIELVRQAKAKGLPVTCEVTPHHLFLCEDDLDEDYDTALKMNPPLRSREDMLALQDALLEGSIDVIATDHAPHAKYEKDQDFQKAPFGTTGLETALPLILTKMVRTGRMDYSRLVELMAHNPRSLVHLPEVSLAPGYSADITIIDPDQSWLVCFEDFVSKSTNSAFVGWELVGKATDVYVGGVASMIDGIPCKVTQ